LVAHQFYFWTQKILLRLSHWLAHLLEDNKQKNSIASLDGVRAIACLTVMGYHISLMSASTNIWDPFSLTHRLFGSVVYAGAAGVTLFFVLSGFLLFMPYARALLVEHTLWPSARRFYLRRAFRIIPAYYACLFLLILIYHRQYLEPAHWKELALFLTFFMESSSITYQQINGPFWTLGVEWQFYMLLPLLTLAISFIILHLFKGCSMKQRLWRVVSCLAALIAWGLFSRFFGYYFAIRPSETFLVPRSVLNVILFFSYGSYGKFLEDFGIGMLISLLFIYAQQVSAEGKFNRGARRLNLWLWGTGIVMLVFLAMWRFNQGHPAWSFLQPLNSQFIWLSELGFSLGFGLCIFAILFGAPALKRPFEWRPLRWIGLISFSLYMWHLPLLIFFMTSVENHLHGWHPAAAFSLYWLWALLGIIPFSTLSYLLFEKPGMALGEKLWRRSEKKQQSADKQAVSATDNPEPENGATIERALVK
jgi:peptidoglycan/LPS O-acetylase OafA/YrhL